MIVELFGPPCVGKTTFACTVAARLRRRYHDVQLVLSYRPSEYPLASSETSTRLRAPAGLRRLARPVIETLEASRYEKGDNTDPSTADLMRLVPSGHFVSSLRLRQYLVRLLRKWRAAERSTIALFDQAFVQVICSSAQLNGTVDAALIAQALDAVPKPDLLVRLDAPAEILEARHAQRRRRQGKIERLLDRRATGQSARVYDEAYELVRTRDQLVIAVDSSNHLSLTEGVHRIEAIVIGRLTTATGQPPEPGGALCQ